MKEILNHCLTDEKYNSEVKRKLFHIITILFLPIIYIFLSKQRMLMIVLPLSILIIATDFYRHKFSQIATVFNKVFGHVLRESELTQNSWTGASFMAIAAIIVFSICPKSIAICAFSILAVSDCLAALVGGKMTSKEFFEKSVAGSMAFGISALVILIICGLFTHQHLSYYFFGAFAVFATTIIEARPSFFSVDDNLTIPLVFATVMMFFGVVWNLQY